MHPLVWLPIILIGALFASLPFLVVRALVYMALRLVQTIFKQSDPESAALSSRRIAAALCAIIGICAAVNEGSQNLEGGMAVGATLLLAGVITMTPTKSTASQIPVEETTGISRRG